MPATEKKIREIFVAHADMNTEGDMMMPFKQHEYESLIVAMAEHARHCYAVGYTDGDSGAPYGQAIEWQG